MASYPIDYWQEIKDWTRLITEVLWDRLKEIFR